MFARHPRLPTSMPPPVRSEPASRIRRALPLSGESTAGLRVDVPVEVTIELGRGAFASGKC